MSEGFLIVQVTQITSIKVLTDYYQGFRFAELQRVTLTMRY